MEFLLILDIAELPHDLADAQLRLDRAHTVGAGAQKAKHPLLLRRDRLLRKRGAAIDMGGSRCRLACHLAVEAHRADATEVMTADTARDVEAGQAGFHAFGVDVDPTLPHVPGNAALNAVLADIQPELAPYLCLVLIGIRDFAWNVVVARVIAAVPARLAGHDFTSQAANLFIVGGDGAGAVGLLLEENFTLRVIEPRSFLRSHERIGVQVEAHP